MVELGLMDPELMRPLKIAPSCSGCSKLPLSKRFKKIAEQLAEATEKPAVDISESRACGGGCIHRAEAITLTDGRSYFLKSNADAFDMFEQEACGLNALQQAGYLRVPRVIALGRVSGQEDYLILEFINSSSPPVDFFANFGSKLAELHRNYHTGWFGWHNDNYLGRNPQINSRCATWTEFFAENRLRYQMRLAVQQGYHVPSLVRGVDKLCERLGDLLGRPDENACLLHGDLWSGNFLCDEDGQPVIFDPAVYLGNREAELSMPLLFGGFPSEFFKAYDEAWPLAQGWRERVEIYKLYHLLNHLNLFGSGYIEDCMRILRRFV